MDAQAQTLLQSALESASCPETDVLLPYGSQWAVLPIVSAQSLLNCPSTRNSHMYMFPNTRVPIAILDCISRFFKCHFGHSHAPFFRMAQVEALKQVHKTGHAVSSFRHRLCLAPFACAERHSCGAQVTAQGLALHFVEPEQVRQRAAEVRGAHHTALTYALRLT